MNKPELISGPTGPYKEGYLQVRVKYQNNIYRIITYHQYIYESEFGQIPNNYVVHHINENKLDNRLDNLELLSRSEHSKFHAPVAETVELICPHCKQKFIISKRHVRSRNKQGYIIHCSRSCARKHQHLGSRKSGHLV